MKRFAFCLFASSVAAVFAQTPVAPPSQDVIHTKSGLDIAGSVSRNGKDNVVVHIKSPTGALVTQQVPIVNIDRIDFAGAENIDAELARYQAANVSILLQKWRAMSNLLDVPESPSGSYGLRAAQLLLESSGAQTAASAGEILDQIIKSDWDVTRRDRARTLVIESMRRTGKHDETLKAAREFLAKDATAESKAEVSYYLGLALMDDYHAFVAENPRWASDPYMHPKRDHLYNEVLDCLLAPYLRYGAPPEATAKSLLAAVTFQDESNDHAEATALAQDIVKIFAAQPEAAQAQKFLDEK